MNNLSNISNLVTFDGCCIETVGNLLQAHYTAILYVRDGLLFAANDFASLKDAGFEPGQYVIRAELDSPGPTWLIIPKKLVQYARDDIEFYFFRKDVVEYLTGSPVESVEPPK